MPKAKSARNKGNGRNIPFPSLVLVVENQIDFSKSKGFFNDTSATTKKGVNMYKTIILIASVALASAFVIFWWKPFGIFAVKK